jgi:hypothetical protein
MVLGALGEFADATTPVPQSLFVSNGTQMVAKNY